MKLFEPREEGAFVTYMGDFGEVHIPNDVYDLVVTFGDLEQRAWEAGFKPEIAKQWVNGVDAKDIFKSHDPALGETV